MEKLIIIYLIFILSIQLNAQTNTDEQKNVAEYAEGLALSINNFSINYKKNIVKLSAYCLPEFSTAYSVDYERNMWAFRWARFNVEGTVGEYFQFTSVSGEDGCFHESGRCLSFTGSINSLLGGNSHFFELNAGARYSIVPERNRDGINQFLPVLNIGYRYQNVKGKGLVFKVVAFGFTGFGISLGKSF